MKRIRHPAPLHPLHRMRYGQTGGESPPPSPALGRRRAASLVEMVVIISIAGVVLSAGVGLIHLLMSAEREATKSVWYGRSLSRLSRIFREDVHAATEVKALPAEGDTGERWELSLPEAGSITYTVDGDRLVRTRKRTDQPVHQDEFAFPPGSTIRFERDQASGLVSLVLNRPSKAARATRRSDASSERPAVMRELRIEATLGRDHGF